MEIAKGILELLGSHAQFFLGLLLGLVILTGGVGYLCWVNPNLKWKKTKSG